MTKLEYMHECTCGRGRCDVPKTSNDHAVEHLCPHGIYELNRQDICDCCPSCTIMCLPMKLVRANKDINNLFNWIMKI